MCELAAGQCAVRQRSALSGNGEVNAKSHHPKVMAFIGETRKSSPYMAERTGHSIFHTILIVESENNYF